MKFALLAMALASFAIGTSEFVLVGVIPVISQSLQVSLSLASLLVSLYAFGVGISAPVLTAFCQKVDRRKLMLGLMTLFTAGNALAPLVGNFEALLVIRIATSAAHGVFFATAATFAANLVPPNKRASAIATVFSGLTIAIALGVPLGTIIAQRAGWRATFVLVTLLGAVSVACMARWLPGGVRTDEDVSIHEQLSVLSSGRLLVGFAMNFFGYGGTFVAITFLSEIITEVAHMPTWTVGPILSLYGVSVIIGNMVGGYLSNRTPIKILIPLFLIQGVLLSLLYITDLHPYLLLLNIAFVGVFSFANVPGLHLYIVDLAKTFRPNGVDVASALNISAANFGIAFSSFVGAKIVSSGGGVGTTPVAAAAVVVCAFVLAVLSYALDKKKKFRDGYAAQ
ncbi:MFS transporter [Gluconobacter sp. R71646]|uniref:Major facilitator superfamily (MFS) profile domain-containing protein n=5 Tax=Acetobacterales TaxID=3120395 RepID=A0A252EJ10_9PROT|nr:MFS sugar transporter [Acetobacter oryzifermentans]ATJ92669.1 MFS transporter [Acetobacter tropicalis]MBF0865375.1 MFS transporter [Gluconobacter sp. R71656]MBF0868860.1 MFS transporter [Gluconobacter sp. R75628]MBF0874864.1 MFS transporter [Gluconobacter sp. R75629]MBF0883520.1 MFS transporter [Gluconobacter potus]OUL66445.1 hypothetical protein HK16_10035 [Acetobacter senegalensis]GFE97882.1 MFS transporter [Gluconobacter sp. Gdi]